MGKNKQTEYRPSFIKSTFGYISSYTAFPFSVSRQIARHSSGCRQLIAEVKDVFSDKNDQKRVRIIKYLNNVIEANNRLTLFFINGPIIASFLFGAAYFIYNYNSSYKFIPQNVKLAYSSVRTITAKEAFDLNFKRQQVRFSELSENIDLKPLLFVFVGHTLGVAGAIILTKHRAFKMENLIKQELKRFNYLDANDQPWRVVWTPEVMLFETYHADPNMLKTNTRFWDQVRFNPDDPVPTIRDQNTYIVFKAGALPTKIVITNWEHPTKSVKSALTDDAVNRALQLQLEEQQQAALQQLNEQNEQDKIAESTAESDATDHDSKDTEET